MQLAINKLNAVFYKIYPDVKQVVFTSLASQMHSTKKILKWNFYKKSGIHCAQNFSVGLRSDQISLFKV